jgi:hypothetical protein
MMWVAEFYSFDAVSILGYPARITSPSLNARHPHAMLATRPCDRHVHASCSQFQAYSGNNGRVTVPLDLRVQLEQVVVEGVLCATRGSNR